MTLRNRPVTHPHDNMERWLLTYADMITLLMALFLMLYSMSVVSRGKFSAVAAAMRDGFAGAKPGGAGIMPGNTPDTTQAGTQTDAGYREYQSAVGSLQQYVQQHKLGSQVTLHGDERGVVISLLADGMLFGRGKAQLQTGSDPLLQRVADVLKRAPNKVQVEGHTCNLPIATAQFPSNWELSTARAGMVLRWFTEQASLSGKRFTAAGYADTRPVAPNTDEANRQRNRRVDIVLLKTDAQREVDLVRQMEIRRIQNAAPAAGSDAAASTPGAASEQNQPAAPASSASTPATQAGTNAAAPSAPQPAGPTSAPDL